MTFSRTYLSAVVLMAGWVAAVIQCGYSHAEGPPGTTAGKEQAMAGRDAPPRKVVVGTLMFAMWGEYRGLESRLETLGDFIDEMVQKADAQYPGARLDLAVLPEVAVTGESGGSVSDVSLPLDGQVLETMGAKAREHRTYVLVPLYLTEGKEKGRYTNAAVLLDRQGEVAGIYRKVHPVAAREKDVMEGGVTPGEDFPVFPCDFGVLGLQICFDINFDDGWATLAEKGAEIVAWTTQSPQTVLPSARAHHHGYYIVSSTWRNNATLFEPTGMIAGQIVEPEHVMVKQIDLTYALLPWQPALRNGKAMEERYGERVGYHYSEAEDGGIFWSNDPEMPIGRMIRDMGLETVDEVLERNLKLQDAPRGGPPSVE